MQIADGHIVTLTYTLRDADGTVLESSADRGPLTFTLGSQRMLPGLAQAITGMAVGETRKGVIPAGKLVPREAAPRQFIALGEFPPGTAPKLGDRFAAKNPEGQPVVFEVVERRDDGVTVLLLPPLHDTEVHYEVEVIAARKPNLPPPPPIDLTDMTDMTELIESD